MTTIFNTSAVAYLWNDNAMATNVGVEGSQGYYLYAYEDKILVLGRDFVNGNWIASAQYVVDYPQTIGDTENEVIEDETVETPTTPSDNAQSAEAPANDYTGMIIGIAAAVAVVAGIAVTAISLKKRNK